MTGWYMIKIKITEQSDIRDITSKAEFIKSQQQQQQHHRVVQGH